MLYCSYYASDAAISCKHLIPTSQWHSVGFLETSLLHTHTHIVTSSCDNDILDASGQPSVCLLLFWLRHDNDRLGFFDYTNTNSFDLERLYSQRSVFVAAGDDHHCAHISTRRLSDCTHEENQTSAIDILSPSLVQCVYYANSQPSLNIPSTKNYSSSWIAAL